jgi:PTH1 family peptidyl-tRNA hydrolase
MNKLIAGLGNPGKKYARNRHNVGFIALDAMITHNLKFKTQNFSSTFRISKKFQAEVAQIENMFLLKPQAFMNRSGEVVRRVKDFYEVGLDDVWIIHDDLDIELGKYKIQKAKGPKQHNGVESVERVLGSNDFWRVRIGVENRIGTTTEGNQRIPGDKYVLSDFTGEESLIMEEVISTVIRDLLERV